MSLSTGVNKIVAIYVVATFLVVPWGPGPVFPCLVHLTLAFWSFLGSFILPNQWSLFVPCDVVIILSVFTIVQSHIHLKYIKYSILYC